MEPRGGERLGSRPARGSAAIAYWWIPMAELLDGDPTRLERSLRLPWSL